MWPFKDKATQSPTYVFDFDVIDKLEGLTPREIITLVCAAFGVKPETACTLADRPPYPSVMHLFKEYKA